MKKKVWTTISTSVVTLATIPLMSTTAFAATTTNNFSSEYQAKVQQEQTLWNEVQSSSVTDSTIQALEKTVTNITTQSNTMYNSWGALNDGVSGIPQIDSKKLDKLANLEGKHKEIQTADKKTLNDVKFDISHRQKAALKHDMQQYQYWNKQLNQVDAQIKALKSQIGVGASPYMGARPALEKSILDLENAAIRYTNVIIELQEQGSTAAGATSTSSGATETSSAGASAATTTTGTTGTAS